MSGMQSFLPFGFLFRVMAMVIALGFLDYYRVIRPYRFLAYVFILFYFIQELFYLATGSRISGILSILPIALGGEDSLQWLEMHNLSERASSFFSEPAHFAQFLLPLLIVELFAKKKKPVSSLLIVLIIVTLLLLQSGNGIFGLLLIIFCYVYKYLFSSVSIKKKIFGVIVSAVIVLLGTWYIRTDTGQELFERRDEVAAAANDNMVSSAYLRMFRGYDLYAELPLVSKIFGVGDKNELIRYITSPKFRSLFGDNDFYFNGLSSILLYSGIVGLLFYVLFLIGLWRNTSFPGHCLVLYLVLLLLIASTYIGGEVAIIIVLANHFKKVTSYEGNHS